MLEKFRCCNNRRVLFRHNGMQLRCDKFRSPRRADTAVDLNGINQGAVIFELICKLVGAQNPCGATWIIVGRGDRAICQQQNNVLVTWIPAAHVFNGLETRVCVRLRLVPSHWAPSVVNCVHCSFQIVKLVTIQVAFCDSFSIGVEMSDSDSRRRFNDQQSVKKGQRKI